MVKYIHKNKKIRLFQRLKSNGKDVFSYLKTKDKYYKKEIKCSKFNY